MTLRSTFLFDPQNAGFLDPRLTFRRTHGTGHRATWQGPDGVWRAVAANTPRFIFDQTTGTRLGVSFGEPGRTNLNTNPLCEGAVVGTLGGAGALPTGWNRSTSGGIGVDIVSVQTINGINTCTLRFYGTASGTAVQFNFEALTGITASPSQTYSPSVFARLDAAPTGPNAHRLGVVGRTAAGASVSGNTFQTTITPTGSLVRYTQTATLTGDVNIARVTHTYSPTLTVGVVYDWTITFGWPQLELGAFATTPILPAAGSPAASTRNAEVIEVDASRLGLSGLTEGTVRVDWRTAPLNTTAQVAMRLTDTSGDHITLRRTSGGILQAEWFDGGVSQASLSDSTTVAASADTRAVLSWASNSFTLTRAGSAEQTDVSGTVPTVTRLLLGASDSDADPCYGTLSRILIWNRQLASTARLSLAS